MRRHARQLENVDAALTAKAEELLAVTRKASAEHRELTEDEAERREELRDEITALKAKAEGLRSQLEVDEEIAYLERSVGRGPAYGNGGRGGHAGRAGGDGWADLAGGIDLEAGRREARVALDDLMLRPRATLKPSPGPAFDPLGFETLRADVAPFGEDTRYLYPWLATQPLPEGVLNVSEWRQIGTEPVIGDPVRDPTATTAKAELEATVEYTPEAVKQLAVTVGGVPNAILAAEPSMLAFLRVRMARLLNDALDQHTIAQILAAGPPTGGAGANLIAQLRDGKSTRWRTVRTRPWPRFPDRCRGARPRRKVDGGRLFISARRGRRFVAAIRNARVRGCRRDVPILIDPAMLGVLYVGSAKLDVDSSGDEFKANLSTVRLEFLALYHVRQPTGALSMATS